MDATEWRDAIEVLRDPTRMCERVMEDGNIPASATIQRNVYVRFFLPHEYRKSADGTHRCHSLPS